MSLLDIYNDVSEALENKKPKLIALLEEHIDFEKIIPYTFYRAFYSHYGRNHIYHLESFIRALLLQKILGVPTDNSTNNSESIIRKSNPKRPIIPIPTRK